MHSVMGCLSGAGAPGCEQQVEVRTIDESVLVEVCGAGIGAAPVAEEQVEVRAVDNAVTVEVRRAGGVVALIA